MLGISNEVLIQELHDLAGRERKITNQILIRINEFERRKLHLELGYASVIEWLIKELHYSEGAAYRRLNAARVLRDVPAAAEKLQDGKLTLSSLASLQSAVRAEERRTSERVSTTLKQELIQNLEEKTRFETAQVLGEAFPEIQLTPREDLRPVSQEESKLTVILDQETVQALTRAKELLSHAIPSGEWSEVIARLAREFLERKDPLRKKASEQANKQVRNQANEVTRQAAARTATSPIKEPPTVNSAAKSQSEIRPAHRRPLPRPLHRAVMQRDHGQCQVRDPRTGRICGSKWQIELDHIQPWALGGRDTLENLRCVCRRHNAHRAEKTFGMWSRSTRSNRDLMTLRKA